MWGKEQGAIHIQRGDKIDDFDSLPTPPPPEVKRPYKKSKICMERGHWQTPPPPNVTTWYVDGPL